MINRALRSVAAWLLLLLAVAGCATSGTPNAPAAPSRPAGQSAASGTAPQSPATAAPASAPQARDPLQELYAKARQEGEVEMWSAYDVEEIAAMAAVFNRRFPGIKIKHTEIRSDDFATRVVAEARQGRVSLDVGTGRLASWAVILERDLLQGYSDWKQLFPDLVESVVSDGKFVGMHSLMYPIGYNTNLVKPDEVPASWEALLEPKWKGKIMVEPRAGAFAYLGLEWGEAKVVDYVKRLVSQDLLFVKGGTELALQLAAGARPVGIGAYTHRLVQDKARGAPVDWAHKVSPLGSGTTSLAIMKGAPHPNAAKLWAGWLATEEAQKFNDAQHFRGVVTPGNPYSVAQEIEKNKIKFIGETLDNYKRVQELSDIAIKALGTRQ